MFPDIRTANLIRGIESINCESDTQPLRLAETVLFIQNTYFPASCFGQQSHIQLNGGSGYLIYFCLNSKHVQS